MFETKRRLMGVLGLGLGLGWPCSGYALDCGDTAGDGGARVSCACGDSMVTDTTLVDTDPIVVDDCPMMGLDIDQPGLTLDCAGLAIDGPGAAHALSIGVLISASRVSVLHCAIHGFQFGIDAADGVGRLLIQANTLTENEKGFRGGEPLLNSKVLGNTASDNLEFGIQLKNGPVGNLIQGNTTVNNGRTGIQLNQRAMHNRIILNYVAGDGSRGGIRVDSASERNRIEDNTVDGGVFGIGFNADTKRNLVRHNVITGADLAGIWFNGPGARNTARSNLITTNKGEGIRVEEQADRHKLERNFVIGNGQGGIKVCGADNRISRNQAFNNTGFDYCIVADSGNRLRFNQGGVFDLACPVPPDGDQCLNLGDLADADAVDDVVEE